MNRPPTPADLDPHNPFWVGDHPRSKRLWAVYFGNGDSMYFEGPGEGWKAYEHADAFCQKLNARYGHR